MGYIKYKDAAEAIWRILNGMGISQKNNDRLVEEVDAVLDEYTAADVRPVVQRETLMQALSKFFSIGDSYTYELNRVKEAFYVGTMELDDFEEWNEDNVSELCDYLMKELFCPNCGADMREES